MKDTLVSMKIVTALRAQSPTLKDLEELEEIEEAIAALADDKRNSKTVRVLARIRAKMTDIKKLIERIP